jgi:hypothetical protein
MRRMITLVLLVLLLPVMAVSAQNSDLKFDLNPETFLNVNDLGFRFFYPEGWIFDNTQGITLVEREADVEPLTDSDDSTNAEGLFMRVLGIPAEGIENFESLTLETAAEDLLRQLGGTATEPFQPVSVLARPGLVVVGTSDDGRAGILTVWKQTHYLVIATLSAPDMDTIIDLAFSWGVVLARVEPIDALPLGKDVLTAPEAGFTIPFPDGWTVNPDNPSMVVELESDITSSESEGVAVLLGEQTLEDTGLDDDATVEDFAAMAQQGLQMDEPVETSQVSILGQTGIMMKGQDTAGSEDWALLISTIVNEQAVILIAFAPTREMLAAFEPTLIAMLEAVQPVE